MYLISRYPQTSETFIVREIDALDRSGLFNLELWSLFPSADEPVHEIQRRWMQRHRRPALAEAAKAFGWAAVTRPRAIASVLFAVAAGYRRSPSHAVRALITVLLACAIARDLSRRPQLPHIHAHYATYPALAAWVCRRLVGSSYSFTAHAHDLYVDTSMLAQKVADARFVVTISEFNRALLATDNPGGTPIHIVHCGIDTTAYQFRPRPIPAEGPVRALTVASLQEYKGHAVLLQALAMGGPGVDRIVLDCIGKGELREDLEQLAARLGIADRVNFLGSRSEVEVRAALDAADLFILPSIVARDGQMEGLPVALMEALACGVPTVSTSLSGIPEIVVDGVTGLLATPADAASLNRTLQDAVQRGERTVEFARAGRELVTSEFDQAESTAVLTALLAGELRPESPGAPR
jgi:glycosyltransferase involved in cell wall biosynthesis